MELTKTRLADGIWEGLLRLPESASDSPPALEISHRGRPIGHDLSPAGEKGGQGGAWKLRIELPPRIISDGLQTVLIRDPESGETLGSIVLLADDPLDQDLRAEVALLRAELDMLKRAFRRQFRESS